MSTIYAKYDGLTLVLTRPVNVRINQMVAITLVDERSLIYKEPELISFAGAMSDSNSLAFETAARESRQIDESSW
jgi:hypothetical protein